MIRIRSYTEKDQKAWDDFVLAHDQGTVFHLSTWKAVIEKSFGHKSHYLIAEAFPSDLPASRPPGLPASQPPSRSRICGVLPLFRIRSLLFGHFMVSVPFAELGGPLADSAPAAAALLREAEKRAAFFNCDYLEFRNRIPAPGYLTKGLYVNFTRRLFSRVDDNFKAIPRKARRMIRQGQKAGLRAESGHHLLPEFYGVMAASYRNLGTPLFPKRMFRLFLERFGSHADLLLIRSPQGIVVAGVLSFFYKDRVVPYYAGSLPESRHLAPNDFMYWELMRRGCEKGFGVFDFGRSKIDTGSYHFKRHWGFEPRPLAYQYHLIRAKEMPNLSPANPKYQKKIELWQKLPLALTRLLGPVIARNLA
jgi:FemAB-related protein (PEP-CTERM system-associated)